MVVNRTFNRRQALTIGVSSALSFNLAFSACSTVEISRFRRRYGANAVAWTREINTDLNAWKKALLDMRGIGLQRVTLISYAFVNPLTGSVSYESENDLAPAPTESMLKSIATLATSLGMEVSIRPWVEIDNNKGTGELWRGRLTFQTTEAFEKFTAQYNRYVLQLAQLARDVDATRFYIGSEMNGLTLNPQTAFHWTDLISQCRNELEGTKCLLSYAANFDEYEMVQFWDHLDEIGVDAYFPLSSKEQSEGEGQPLDATLRENTAAFLMRLEQFSIQKGLQVFICEWGVVPFDTTSSDPSNEQPSDTADRDEALRAYKIFTDLATVQASWLSGVDFWHWSVDPIEDSNYRIEPDSDFRQIIKNSIETADS